LVITSKCHFSTLTNSIHQSNHSYNNKSSQDVLQSEDAPNKFFFYEVYQDADAIAHHKLQPVSLLPVFCIKQFTIHLLNTHFAVFLQHYLAWGDFKESGGTLSSVSKKASGKFMT
jgi:hypothetical protein